jgi:AraC-like DNA-binding protein
MEKIAFRSDQLGHLHDGARAESFREFINTTHGLFDLTLRNDCEFSAHCEMLRVDATAIQLMTGTIECIARTASNIAADPSDVFCFLVNIDSPRLMCSQKGNEIVLDRGAATLLTQAEPGAMRGEGKPRTVTFLIPRERLLETAANAEDLVAELVDPGTPIARHLSRYANMLFESDELADGPSLLPLVDKAIIDLVALSLSGRGHPRELDCIPGVRAMRVHEIVALMREGFCHPSFSSQTVARRLGISTRYVQDLLHETGANFSERLLHLRLEKARVMLAQSPDMKIGDIALLCGFNEISYFNRCFRRQFGESPRAYRGTRGSGSMPRMK